MYSQNKYVEKYNNGNIKINGFVKNKVLDSIYEEYFESGELKILGFFKNCNYQTNRTGIYKMGCGTGKKNSIRNGKRHGIWKWFYKNGKIKSLTNYHCDFVQGTSFSYYENGKIETVEFYSGDEILTSQYFNENGILEEYTFYTYEYNKKESRTLKTTKKFIYYEDGKLKSKQQIIEKPKNIEIEIYNEYFKNGFLKIEAEYENDEKNGIYREYYENGNVKYEGFYKKGIPVKKHYFYKENGKLLKIEIWKKGKKVNK